MCIAYPRESAGNTNDHGQIGDDAHDKYGTVVIFVVDEDKGDFEDQPHES